MRSDLTQWLEIGITGNVAGTASLVPTNLVPGMTTYPCLVLQNNSTTTAANLSFRALNGGSTIAIAIPAGDFCYLPQIDYATGIVSITTASGTCPCTAWLGYVQ
jgi:hypothetical protein